MNASGGSTSPVTNSCTEEEARLPASFRSNDPDVSIVIPVNAQGDLHNVLCVLEDLARYDGRHQPEVVLVVNNYPAGSPPRDMPDYEALGARVLMVPDTRQHGVAVVLSARMRGTEVARAPVLVHFDGDCRIPHPTELIDWYMARFAEGAQAAYTHVDFYDLVDTTVARVSIAIHHSSRWFKRNVLRIPTTRGSNYAVRRDAQIELYESGWLADDLNVGPVVARKRGRVAYSGARDLEVRTSGRMYSGSTWRRLLPYYWYRLRYNLRVLPVRKGVAQRTGRENDGVRRYVDNRPVSK